MARLQIKTNGGETVVVDIFDTISSGAYGTAYKGKYKGKIVVVKKFSQDTSSESEFAQECKLLKQARNVNNQYILEYYFHGIGSDGHMYLCTEHCGGGEFFDHIYGKQFSEKESREFIRQILEGLYALHHKLNIAHRDIKPENILLKNRTLKIIDFGFACSATDSKRLVERMGTVYYIAPEVLEKKYSRLCDVWSCGVILYILLCGFPPFYGDTDDEIYNMIRCGKYSFEDDDTVHISNSAKNLISKMLCPETNRLNVEQCLKHPWFNELKHPHHHPHHHSVSTDSIDSDSTDIYDEDCQSHISSINTQSLQEECYDWKYNDKSAVHIPLISRFFNNHIGVAVLLVVFANIMYR